MILSVKVQVGIVSCLPADKRILYETDKAILVECGSKMWIPKSQIHGIRLRKNVFEVYVREGMI